MRKKLYWLFAALLILLWGHYVWLRVGKPPMDDAARAKFGKKSIALSAGKTAFEYHEGEGGAVVLVHGFSIPSVIWDNTYRALVSAGFKVLRYDLYGRGFSDRPAVKYNADLFVAQLKELTDEIIGSEKFALCGLSMGGAISVQFADRYPDRVDKLILIDPAGFPMAMPAAAKLVKLPVIGDYAGRILARKAIAKSLPLNFTGSVPPAVEAAGLIQTDFAGYDDAIVSTLRHMNLTDLKSTYESVGRRKVKTLLLWGKHDQVVPYAHAESVRTAIPGAKFVSFSKSGHIPTVDEKDKANQVILSFLGIEE
jgi:pimeloyl-ACP methyl ester carboxylesterase